MNRAIVAMAATLLLLAACGGPSSAPEEEIRAWLAEAEAAAEAKQRRRLVAMISSAYVDARGNERDDIENTLRAYFFRQNSVKLLLSVEEIRVFGDSAAEVDLTVGMAGTNDGVLGFSADAYRFELELQRNDDNWQLLAARWGELGKDVR